MKKSAVIAAAKLSGHLEVLVGCGREGKSGFRPVSTAIATADVNLIDGVWVAIVQEGLQLSAPVKDTPAGKYYTGVKMHRRWYVVRDCPNDQKIRMLYAGIPIGLHRNLSLEIDNGRIYVS